MSCNRKMIAAKHIICVINELQAADCTLQKTVCHFEIEIQLIKLWAYGLILTE
uniref:Uncharacterized protein LOC108044206 n=1 Tax=Drosophila rhopaloa TaxID=1041015 RepID=A0A6P4EPM9_DRORH